MHLIKIEWAPSETLIKIGDFGIHYYSLMFIIAFSLGYYIMKKIFSNENVSEEEGEEPYVESDEEMGDDEDYNMDDADFDQEFNE